MPHLRTRLVALTGAVAVALSTASATTPPAGAADLLPSDRPGLQLLLADAHARGLGIATFDTVPTAAQVDALVAEGLVVQPMQELPLALVAGTDLAMQRAVADGTALDVYPDEVLQQHDTASSDVMSSSPSAARALRARGFTGKGTTVGIVDSGCDGTHPDLAEQIAHNVTLVSGEYANQPPSESNTLVVPTARPVFDNSDGTTGPGHLGVAPDAELACFGIGAVITTTAVVTAYDYAMRQPKMLGIDVFNNSWGNSYRQYDPSDPVNVATKAVTERGAVVVFSAGNSGSSDGESSVSPFNQAPWVVSVAASDLDRRRGDFSSNGQRYDNSAAVRIGEGGHTVFRGDRRGLTQPDVSAPGVDISSSCDSTGTVIGPCPDHGNTEASGTSMSAPHVAGAAAVLVGANPRLTPGQVQAALEATATPMRAGDRRLGSWQVGYGHVNLDRAVRLVRGAEWRTDLRQAKAAADRRLAREDAWAVSRSDLWQDDAPPVAALGSYAATRRVDVARGTDALKLTLVYPTPGTAANLARFSAQVVDRRGEVVARTTTDTGYALGVASALVRGIAPGRYRIEVRGDYAVSDPDTVDSDSVNGRVVFLQAAQLRRR